MSRSLPLILCAILGTTVASQAQSPRPYDPLLQSTTNWAGGIHDFFTRTPYSYSFSGTTTIAPLPFTYFIMNRNGQQFLLREDISQRQVYVIFPGESRERLLYDFRAQVGNTFNLNYGTPNPRTFLLTVQQRDSVWTTLGYRTRIVLTGGNQGRETWIEGVGSDHSPLYLADAPYTDPVPILYCAYRGTQHIYTGQFAPSSAPCPRLLATRTALAAELLQLQPQPDGSLKLSFTTRETTIAQTTVTDAVGRRIFTCAGLPTTPLPAQRWGSGLYLVTVVSTRGDVLTRKFQQP